MRIRFLLGPAGSGKTFRCLEEIRASLELAPDGPALLLVAPKQATFQLERQLLAESTLQGYTRLAILSFERLARFALKRAGRPAPRLLSAEGRVMVLRALLAQQAGELELFGASARRPGFAQRLSDLLGEFQRHHQSAARLDELAALPTVAPALRGKLRDSARLLRAYQAWLAERELQDADQLLDLAADAMRTHAPARPPDGETMLGALWLDGFAELTPQELALLSAFAPVCERLTLAFCLEQAPSDDLNWLSTWSGIAHTFRRCYQRLAGIEGAEPIVEILSRDPNRGRFADQPALAHLESNWAQPRPFEPPAPIESSRGHMPSEGASDPAEQATGAASIATLDLGIGVYACANPEAEAILAAREILRFVRRGWRFRDCAALVREFTGYAEVLRRVFTRYEIPFFLDRREPVAHHPLAELTRYALRTVALGWTHDDWFGALKTGLVPADETEIDVLENEALARGWTGVAWRRPLAIAEDLALARRIERIRAALVPPFLRLGQALVPWFRTGEAAPTEPRSGPASTAEGELLSSRLTGSDLAGALRAFWEELKVEAALTEWSESGAQPMHLTVWTEMQGWLDNLALAFPSYPLPIREWLPILEAGLAGLTAGAVPPALDQVLIGAVARSRNPDLQFVTLLGLNESVFPATPAIAGLLTEADREQLEEHGAELIPNKRFQLGQERFYGYIACTRARRRLVLTYSTRDTAGDALNPSPFAGRVIRMFPQITAATFDGGVAWPEAEHARELLAPLFQSAASGTPGDDVGRRLAQWPVFAPAFERWQRLQSLRPPPERLSAASVRSLYGATLATSVSALEDFAACPFKFFVGRGLLARERKRFEVDVRERGSFQHEVLEKFHQSVKRERRNWRDLSPAEASERIGAIGAELAATYGAGLFQASDEGRFTAGLLIAALQELMGTLIGWMAQYEFDPVEVELAFGLPPRRLPAWVIDLGGGRRLELRGKIDRVDLYRAPGAADARTVVIDYKSSERKLDPTLLHHGLQLQLLSYLGFLEQLTGADEVFGAGRLIPAGAFYVSLRSNPSAAAHRREALAGGKSRYQHQGRFVLEDLPRLDNRRTSRGDQFRYARNKDGSLSARGSDAVAAGEFQALLAHVKGKLVEYGQEIFAGNVKLEPYRKGTLRACDRCDFLAACRFDAWQDSFRVLRPPTKSTATKPPSP